MTKRLRTTTLIVLLAAALQLLKVAFLYLVANHLPEPRSEAMAALYAIALYVLILPETLVSFENGPHGLAARIVMFIAGTLANVLVITIVVWFWQNIRNRKRTVTTNT